MDLLTGKEFGHVAEKGVDVTGGGEIARILKEFGGESFRITYNYLRLIEI